MTTKLMQIIFMLLLVTNTTACASWWNKAEPEEALWQTASSPLTYQTYHHSRAEEVSTTLQPYVDQMMNELVSNLVALPANSSIAVANMVPLDSQMQQTNILGLQIAESFMLAMHEYGAKVIDFKTMSFIRISPTGDFVFSRDFSELNLNQNVDFVLSGTMTDHQLGVLLNVRLVGLKSQQVMAATQSLLPHSIVDSLFEKGMLDGVLPRGAR